MVYSSCFFITNYYEKEFQSLEQKGMKFPFLYPILYVFTINTFKVVKLTNLHITHILSYFLWLIFYLIFIVNWLLIKISIWSKRQCDSFWSILSPSRANAETSTQETMLWGEPEGNTKAQLIELSRMRCYRSCVQDSLKQAEGRRRKIRRLQIPFFLPVPCSVIIRTHLTSCSLLK
jgi:hypothetical protein